MRDKCWWVLGLMCLLSSCCELAVAQVKLAEVKLQTYIGFENPRIVDGVVVAGPNSKPSLASSVSLITVDKPDSYKFGEIEAERIPTFELVELEAIDGGYRFPNDTQAGTYRVTYRAFDPERGPSTKRITVDVGGSKPVDPFVPPDPALAGISKDVRQIVVQYAQSMGADYERLAVESKAGRYLKVIDASNAANAYDVATRDAFKRSMGAIMAPRLGVDNLPADAAQTFTEIAIGFRSVK